MMPALPSLRLISKIAPDFEEVTEGEYAKGVARRLLACASICT
jgi:hypothetical protein